MSSPVPQCSAKESVGGDLAGSLRFGFFSASAVFGGPAVAAPSSRTPLLS